MFDTYLRIESNPRDVVDLDGVVDVEVQTFPFQYRGEVLGLIFTEHHL